MESWAIGITGYFVIWWTMLFVVLPWGVVRDAAATGGDDHGAPVDPKIKQKFIATSVVSAIVWLIIYAMIHFGVIDWLMTVINPEVL